MADAGANTAGAEIPDMSEMRRSSRDPGTLRGAFTDWLSSTLGPDARPEALKLWGTSATGMSSETILLDARWTEDGSTATHELVARMAPDATDVPVFPNYDLGRQFDVIRLAGERTNIPVPKTYWLEQDPGPLGTPFFVMERIAGEVPPDVMPYTFGDNWLFDASPEDQRRLQDTTVATIAELHTVPASDPATAFLAFDQPGDTALARHLAHTRAWYEWVVGDGPRSPLLDRAFAHLEANLPAPSGDPVLCWGDSRIGNAMYRDFEPVAVLDWEMAAVGPRELDVTWLIYAHMIFNHIAQTFELPGMPDFMKADDVADRYESLTGHRIADLDWYLAYAATQYGIVFLRTGQRAVHFGDQEMPENFDDLMHHRAQLAELVN
jgi:aminoglycoside phosphotransferase (APT) family kinase protein